MCVCKDNNLLISKLSVEVLTLGSRSLEGWQAPPARVRGHSSALAFGRTRRRAATPTTKPQQSGRRRMAGCMSRATRVPGDCSVGGEGQDMREREREGRGRERGRGVVLSSSS